MKQPCLRTPVTFNRAVETDITLINSSFEEPVTGVPVQLLDTNAVPGWTMEPDPNTAVSVGQEFEFWSGGGGNPNVATFDGDQHIEIDAWALGTTLSQPLTVPQKPGELRWSLWHTSRRGQSNNIGEIEIEVAGNVTTAPFGGSSVKNDNDPIRWTNYSGVVPKPAGDTATEIRITPLTSANGGGNRSHVDLVEMVFWEYVPTCGWRDCCGKVWDAETGGTDVTDSVADWCVDGWFSLGGPQGDPGPMGPPGPSGDSWTSDAGAPAGPGSNDGDHYLDLTTGDVYEWDGAAWTAQGSIRGLQGVQGLPGTPGADAVDSLSFFRAPVTETDMHDDNDSLMDLGTASTVGAGWLQGPAINEVTRTAAASFVEGTVNVVAVDTGASNYWSRPYIIVQKNGNNLAWIDAGSVMQANGTYSGRAVFTGSFLDDNPQPNDVYSYVLFNDDNRTATLASEPESHISLKAIV